MYPIQSNNEESMNGRTDPQRGAVRETPFVSGAVPEAATDRGVFLAVARILPGVTASYASWAVAVVVPLLLVPMLVRFLGHELYGQWVVILSLTSYLGLANLGMGQAAANMVAEANARAQNQLLVQVTSTAFFFHALLAIPLLALSVLVGAGYFGHILPLRSGGAQLALSVTYAFTALSLPLRVSSLTLRSLHRVDVEQTTVALSNMFRAVSSITALLLGFKLLSVAVVHGLALVASGAAAYLIIHRRWAGARPRILLFSWRLLQKMVVPSMGFLVLSMASTLTLSIDNLIIAYKLSPGAVTQYAVPFQVVMLLIAFFGVTLGALTPAITDGRARGSANLLSSAYVLVTRAAILFGASATIFLWLAGRQLIEFWAGAGVFPGYTVFALQLILLFSQVSLYPSQTILTATSTHYGYAAWAITEGVLNLALSLWWVHVWGLAGIVGGTVVARVFTTGWYMPVAAMRVLGFSWRHLLGRVRRALLVAALSILFVTFSSFRWSLGSGVGSVAAACTATLAFIAVFLAVELTSRESFWLKRQVAYSCKAVALFAVGRANEHLVDRDSGA
jgi:O-antigen/teichoic acid export membrane protein